MFKLNLIQHKVHLHIQFNISFILNITKDEVTFLMTE